MLGLLHQPGRILDPLAYTSGVLGLQVCGTMPSLRNAGYQMQDFMHARLALYQLNYTLSPRT